MAAKTLEERIALIDQKIAKKETEIAELKAKKEKLLHPVTMKTVMEKIKETGMSPEDIAKKLELEL